MQEQTLNHSSKLKAGTAVYLAMLLMIFVAFLGALAVFSNPRVLHDPLILVLVGLASFRGGRALAYNFIFSWLRSPFTLVVDDSSGAGKSVEAFGAGLHRVIGELLCCPMCAGTWVGLTLAGLLVLVYPFGLLVTFVLAASGIGEMLHWRAERDEWQGRAAREDAGSAWLWKNKAVGGGQDWIERVEAGHEKKAGAPF